MMFLPILVAVCVVLTVAVPPHHALAFDKVPHDGRLTPSQKATCPYIISFTSVGRGIHRGSWNVFTNFVAQNAPHIQLTAVVPWGKEGERDACINFSDRRQSGILLKQLAADLQRTMSLGNGRDAGPVTIHHCAGGATYLRCQ
ncbi:MAG: hypothetical protein EBZ69_03200 [Alphaproteobacteria bacterium]|nr:hypothetical protein [Alphaproteobacteria bacterium]NDG04430.1 hypothetical protein [Alphaproteobacteria bacterium]